MKTKNAPQLNQKIKRLFNIEVKSIDEENRTVDFVFSDDSIDRYGEVVDQSSWDTKHYEANPVFLWGHDPSQMENIIGTGGNLQLNVPNDAGGHQSILTAQFADEETNPKGDLAFRMVKSGLLRTVSAGFIPHSLEWDDDTPILKDNELLEVSLVGIPANRNAVALAFKSGEMKQKDAEYLAKSMREGADAIEAELKSAEEDEKTIADLTAAIATLTESVTALQGQVEELKAAPPEGEEEEEQDDPDPAKGGDNDQPGAEEDIDLETEITDDEFEELEVSEDEEESNE